MTLHRIRVPFVVCLAMVAFSGAAQAKKPKHKFVKTFVPPAGPKAPPVYEIPQPPIDPLFFAKEVPREISGPIPVHQSQVEIDMRISGSLEHFKAGSALVAKGSMDLARTEFDRAVELLIGGPESAPGRERLVSRYKELADEIYRLESQATTGSTAEGGPVFDKAPLEEIADMTFPVEPGLKGKVKEQLSSTVSQLPLETADPVISFINYFNSGNGRKVFEAGLRRMGRYGPMIRRILDEEGLPQELVFLAQAESGFMPRAVSYMQAVGMWQFVQFRGREYGLNQTPYFDDRLDPEKATRAAARHLRDLHAQFGDWYLAVAAYNCGPMAVERAVQRTGYADFWEMYGRQVLPRETSSYVPIILAMTIMAKNPKDYGLTGIVQDPPLEYDTITVTAPTHLNLISDILDRPVSLLKELNPAILWQVAPANYAVHVPKGSGRAALAVLESIPAAHRIDWRMHRVTAGETLASITQQYRVTEQALVEANPHSSSEAKALEPQKGDLLVVPAAYPGGGPEQTVRRVSGRRTASRSIRSKTPSRAPVRKPTTVSSTRKPAARAVTRAALPASARRR